MEKVAAGDYQAELQTLTAKDLTAKTYHEAAKKMVDFVVEALNSGRLAQAQVLIDNETPVTFALETSLINLPLANAKKLPNFMDEDSEQEVKVYFEIISDYINVSHFRIDELATGDELIAENGRYIEEIAGLLAEKTTFVAENAVVMLEQEKERAEAKKIAEQEKAKAKKTTKKKTTTKKTTTKKTTAKKTTKKPATKKKAKETKAKK